MAKSIKSILAAVFSLFFVLFCNISFAQEKHTNSHETEKTEKKAFDANEVIFGHVLDAHEFHFLSYKGDDGKEHHATIPLPVILYSKEKGVDVFMSSKFHHGEQHSYKGYDIITDHKIAEQKLDPKKYTAEQIVAVNENGEIDPTVKVYDVSLTRNVVQMIIALALLVWVMLYMAKKYRSGQGVTTAPKGVQNLIEPVITFVRDDVAKPNLGVKYKKYFPYLLTVFFFILINNLVGLIPGSANVTGNIAFTMVLALISFIIIMLSTNKHYWGHIFNPPGIPLFVKFILVPVEILGVFTKPFALMIRLFANMIAGHIIIICLVSLIFIFGALSTYIGWGFSPLSIAFVVFIYFIEILVAFLQAYIFTNLAAVFIGQAFEGGHEDVNGHAEAVIV
ncbi:MAG TPA: F0F1 ATP synthase subunit A [Chitinophagaceae bacterium]|nr:F0F1 ATP synthase subunit A [Chitinophagaceae bacterium]